ncbi:MAG: HAD family phosphatase [Deltaproteobacteria bacterium]|nr:HAD family phosphatase [Deltaproteobacteria bacterium]
MNFPEKANREIEVVFFDFGGVLAEEGFKQGLMAIGATSNLGPQKFFEIGERAIYETGYVVGKVLETDYWNAIRKETGIKNSDFDMRAEILNRFKLRPWMLGTVDRLSLKGYFVALLSDQTNWLDELDARSHFCGHFDAVFNSYHFGKGKRDVSVFLDVAHILGISPESCLLIDDNPGNIARASSLKYKTILFNGRDALFQELTMLELVNSDDLIDIISD